MTTLRIIPGDFSDPQVIALLAAHLAGMHESSPPGQVSALDLSGVQAPDVSFYGAREGETLVGMGALRALSANTGELKSMRTHAAHLRKGVAALMLEHLIAEARSRGYTRLSLETGRGPAFDPAIALYRKYGFAFGDSFGDYQPNAFSQFLHLDL
ncbi:MAG: GNAT family N-acetyltransferase [Alphaproteobacteria bacterium]